MNFQFSTFFLSFALVGASLPPQFFTMALPSSLCAWMLNVPFFSAKRALLLPASSSCPSKSGYSMIREWMSHLKCSTTRETSWNGNNKISTSLPLLLLHWARESCERDTILFTLESNSSRFILEDLIKFYFKRQTMMLWASLYCHLKLSTRSEWVSVILFFSNLQFIFQDITLLLVGFHGWAIIAISSRSEQQEKGCEGQRATRNIIERTRKYFLRKLIFTLLSSISIDSNEIRRYLAAYTRTEQTGPRPLLNSYRRAISHDVMMKKVCKVVKTWTFLDFHFFFFRGQPEHGVANLNEARQKEKKEKKRVKRPESFKMLRRWWLW